MIERIYEYCECRFSGAMINGITFSNGYYEVCEGESIILFAIADTKEIRVAEMPLGNITGMVLLIDKKETHII